MKLLFELNIDADIRRQCLPRCCTAEVTCSLHLSTASFHVLTDVWLKIVALIIQCSLLELHFGLNLMNH